MSSLVQHLAGTPALRFVREPGPHSEAIVIVGATCTGKTTLVRTVRGFPGIDVPRRYVTRAPREDDVAGEQSHITSAELDALIATGAIAMHWSRTLELGHIERYAFARPVPGVLPVYSANNAICIPGNVVPANAVLHALIVGIHAPEALREQRLRARSHVLWRDRPDEARARLAERADAMQPYVHAVIENSDAEVATRALGALIRAACAALL